jgi:hypothetical protein
MKYCPNCGKPVDPKAVICPNCGVPIATNNSISNTNSDSGSTWWAVLGFFIPVVGLILYIVWKNDEPKNAKKAGLGALISVCVSLGFFTLCMFIAALAGLTAA